MRRFALVTLIAVATAAGGASAEEVRPYAGLQTRPIKALSGEQIADLRAGRGMGLALAAELNGYPGPRHVIDLAEPLELSDRQRADVERLFEAMHAEAIRLGERVIETEAALDRAFAERTIALADIDALTDSIGEAQASLRAAHLKYHVATLTVLTPEQAELYAELRGYTSADAARHGHGGHPKGH
jgi:Spy/CpxP family protein refolding chaperone